MIGKCVGFELACNGSLHKLPHGIIAEGCGYIKALATGDGTTLLCALFNLLFQACLGEFHSTGASSQGFMFVVC